MNKISPIKKAVQICGSQSALARKIGKKPQHVQYWAANDRIPAEQAIPIEVATQGAVTRHELRPDIYPLEASA